MEGLYIVAPADAYIFQSTAYPETGNGFYTVRLNTIPESIGPLTHLGRGDISNQISCVTCYVFDSNFSDILFGLIINNPTLFQIMV